VESRENKRPLMSDLRDSGSIEQDADIVMFLHRDDYNKPADEVETKSSASEAELIISKHRNGRTGKINLIFDKATGVFKE
jgi:replicative DNA helicase